MVSQLSAGPREARFTLGRKRGWRTYVALVVARSSHEMSFAARARRDRVSQRLRHPRALKSSRARALPPDLPWDRTRSALLAWRITKRPLRRQLKLARTDLVAAELPAHRIIAAIPLLLRR